MRPGDKRQVLVLFESTKDAYGKVVEKTSSTCPVGANANRRAVTELLHFSLLTFLMGRRNVVLAVVRICRRS
jgi:hypothetical protein